VTNESRADVEGPAATSPVRRLAGLDGLRGVALVAVILVHVIIILPKTGYAQTAPMVILAQLCRHGLTVFFVLSGFLIFRPFASAVAQRRALPNTGGYAINRVLRIWPAYLVILTIATVILPWGIVAQHGGCPGSVTGCDRQVIGRLTDPLTLLANVTLLQGWFPSTAFTGLGVSWSLVTEVGFYVLVPFLGLAAAAFSKRISPTAAVFLPGFFMVALGACFRWTTHAMWLQAGHVDDIPFAPTWLSVINRSVLGQADTFGLGMLLAATVVWSRSMSPDGHKRLRRCAWILLMAAPVVTALAIALGARSGELATEAIAVAAAALMAILLLPLPGPVSRGLVNTFEIRVLRYLGEYSLSWYLWHYPVVLWFRAHAEWVHFDSLPTMVLALVVVCVPISALAWVTYTFVEAPAMTRKRRAG
jgi:peptidoglycan/LPS O-acetylase OafA/YrhL